MIKNNKIFMIVFIGSIFYMGVYFGMEKHSYIPPDGFVPNKETAIRIAEAVLIPIYGKDVIEKEKPFTVKLENGVWIINGTLPRRMLGGVAEIEIVKKDGKILRVSHGK